MINVIDHEGVVELSLARPPVNALTTEFIGELSRAYADATANGAKAVILSGREGLFSAGLDVPELLPKERKDIEQFWHSFFELLNEFMTSNIPIGAYSAQFAWPLMARRSSSSPPSPCATFFSMRSRMTRRLRTKKTVASRLARIVVTGMFMSAVLTVRYSDIRFIGQSGPK